MTTCPSCRQPFREGDRHRRMARQRYGWDYEYVCYFRDPVPPAVTNHPRYRPDHPNDPAVDETSRESLIAWLSRSDPQGFYTDKDSAAEGFPPLTLEQAQRLYHEELERQANRGGGGR